MKNYYTLLGIPDNASLPQINEAYKKLAQKYHPDKNDNDPYFTALFKEINDAKQVLTNTEERAEYDLMLTNYADAYDLFIHQKLEDDFNRQQRKKQVEKVGAKKQTMFILVGIAVFLLMGFFLLAEMDISPLIGDKKKTSKPFLEIADTTNNTPLAAAREIKDTAERVIPSSAVTKSADIDRTENGKMPKKLVKKAFQKQFSQQQLNEILERIKVEKLRNNYNTNCITIKKTKNSNVDTNFAIAGFLQRNGFVISGRELISNDLKGFDVKYNGVCLNLTIGTM